MRCLTGNVNRERETDRITVEGKIRKRRNKQTQCEGESIEQTTEDERLQQQQKYR